MQQATKIFRVLLLISWWYLPSLTAQQTVQVELVLQECGNNINLYRFEGFAYKRINQLELSGDTAVLQLPATDRPRFYFVGPDTRHLRYFIAGTEPKLRIQGACKKMRQADIVGSQINALYASQRSRLAQLRQQSSRLTRELARKNPDSTRSAKIMQELATLDQQQLDLLDEIGQQSPYIGKVLALDVYLSYFNNKGDYTDEVDYFINEFFAQADLTDTDYHNMPLLFEKVNSYTSTLARVGLSEEAMLSALDKLLVVFPDDSPARLMAHSAMVLSLESNKHPALLPIGDRFVERYEAKHPEMTEQTRAKMNKLARLMPGAEAPDFSQRTPDGEELSLSDLRGQYVLLDFWASWCKPCRVENPNVVRMHNAYKEEGFTVLSVSLDTNRDRWLKAIEADNMDWHHISDLKGWRNAAAKLYEVRSIPATLLIGPDGKIIAKNLRGPRLERKLAQLLGNN